MNDKQKIDALKFSIDELRRRYDLIKEMYRSAITKMFAFIGAGFGLLTYLNPKLSDFVNNSPQEQYGKILYFFAMLLIIGALYKLFNSIRGVYWEYPLHIVKLKNIEESHSELEYYRYIKNDYIRAVKIVDKTYGKVYKGLNESSIMLACGGILVIVIKVFT